MRPRKSGVRISIFVSGESSRTFSMQATKWPAPPSRRSSRATQIEILTPDFRGRMDRALEILKAAPPDVMNHNLETAPRLYKEARPGSDYAVSLNLLKRFKEFAPNVPTKSGVMVGTCGVNSLKRFRRLSENA